MDMYQYRKKRKEMKSNENKEEIPNQMNINCEEQANVKLHEIVEK